MRKHFLTFPLVKPRKNAVVVLKTYELFVETKVRPLIHFVRMC